MRPARLDLAIRSAMQPATAPGAAAAPVPPSPPPPGRRKFALIRRLFGRVLGPIADYARRYLQAPVSQRLDALEHRLDLTLEAVRQGQQAQQAQFAEQRTLAVKIRSAQNEQSLRQQAIHATLLDQVQLVTGEVERSVAGLAGLFGPRFDELEVKLRPVIAYDDESVAIRMGDGYVLAPRAEPLFTVMLADATTGGLEPGTRRVLKRLVAPGMHVADVGANIGLLTLVMARGTGAQGRVYAFEPEAGPRDHLTKTKALNGLAWVDIRPVAVGREPGRLTFHVSDIIGHSSLYALPEDEERRARLIEVEVVRLDDALGAGARLDVVKIDVEGAELDVLAGMAGLLAANPDLAIIAEYGPSHLVRVGLTPDDWFSAFAAHGLTPYAIEEPTGRCAPCAPAALAGIESVNIAFVRPGGEAQRRLTGA